MDNLTQPGNSSYGSFEKILLQIRKFKSHLFAVGEHVTIERLYHGGYMTDSNRSTFVPACGHMGRLGTIPAPVLQQICMV
jgi:hypothetical protein